MRFSVTLLLLSIAPFTSALDYAAVRGTTLINNATRGMITMNGIWYSTSNSTTDTNAMDSLKDARACTRDAALMAQLGINTIYVMAIDPNANHDECFSIFNAVGIYIMVVLRKDGVFVTTYEDFARSYTTDFLKTMFQIIDAVKDYDNVLTFDLGVLPTYTGHRQSVNGMTWSDMLKTYRAFVRDTKGYIAHNALRPIIVGTNLQIVRYDERLEPSDLAHSHMYYFTCAIDGKTDDVSRSDYISVSNIAMFYQYGLKYQKESYVNWRHALAEATTPVWFSYMGVFEEIGSTDYTLRPELLDDTLFLFNRSSLLIRPSGIFTGGARLGWTNTNMEWKLPKVNNWGLTITSPDGSVQLTENYNAYRKIFDSLNTGSWLSGRPIPDSMASAQLPRCDSNAKDLSNQTILVDNPDRATSTGGPARLTLTMATDWALPTRPPGLDALVTNGVNGKRGQMVDVTVTTIAYPIRDSKGAQVTNLSLKPSSSQTRTTTSTETGTGVPAATSSSSLGTGAKAGICVGVGVGGIASAAILAFFLLRRRRNQKQAMLKTEHLEVSDGATGFHKAELATEPLDKKPHIALPHDKKELQEVAGNETFSSVYQEPVELPVTERPVEAPTIRS